MNNHALYKELKNVGRRYRSLWMSIALCICWTVLALIGIAAIVIAVGRGQSVNGWISFGILVAAVVCMPIISMLLRRTLRPDWVAHRIERKYPDLNARLLAALEQTPDPATQKFGYLQSTVVSEAIEHSKTRHWETIVAPSKYLAAMWSRRAALVGLITVFAFTLFIGPRRAGSAPDTATVVAGETSITVEPGDTSVERGTGMLVLARFTGQLPGEVKLLSRDQDGNIEQVQMSKSLDDPVFAARIPSVKSDLQYAVRYGDAETKWYSASVFEFPDLKQADANLKFPTYTGEPDKLVEDVRSITAVEGTKATLKLRLNKPVADAVLLPNLKPVAPDAAPMEAAGPVAPLTIPEPIKLVADANEPNVYTALIDLKQSQTLRLELMDAEGRQNKQPASELTINVNPNRPPELKPVTPGRDVDVSPIQELSTGVRVWDDFGVQRVGIAYSMAGLPPQDLVLSTSVPAKERRDVSHLLSFEQFKAQPDQLLSYYFWAEDYATDGTIRRTSGDMYFAEVRPFEEIFRQGQQPSESEQLQQQREQQQQSQNAQNGQQAEQLAELQKQVIAATWKIIRREVSATLSSTFSPDVTLVSGSQTSAREQATAMEERLTDVKSRGYLKNVLNHMDRAVTALNTAQSGNLVAPLTDALAAEQAAYQELLKLRAREFEVIRGNRQQQQQQGQQSASSASSRRQQQLDQLQMEQEQNRYETQRSAAAQQEANPQQRETRQVLNRLKELAQRQEDLNRQMREIQSALEQARDAQQREELQRQLARLRDQQQQQLRDTDELRDRLDQPENQERMADTRQQLEQTRENVRRASESLEQGMVPEATTSGARASEQLNNLREEVRREASGQFSEAMTDLRQDARELDDRQKELSEKLTQLDTTEQRSLRESTERQQVTQNLAEQKQQLDQLLDTMRKTVDESESSEPLLSKQLYETLRQTGQQRTEEALDVSRQLLERGFTNEARQAETEAGKGITRLREGVEQAATSVLGDEAESLRRARNELNRLTEELQREVERNRPIGAGPATRPSGRATVASANEPTTRGSQISAGTRQPTTRGSQQAAAGNRRPTTQGSQQVSGASREPTTRNSDQAGRVSSQQNGEPSQQTNAGQPGAQEQSQGQLGERQGQQAGQPGQANADSQQPGQGQPGQGQPGDRQPGEQQAQSQGQRQGQAQGRGQGQPSENQPGDSQAQQNQPDQNQAGESQAGGNQSGENQSAENQPGEQQAQGEGQRPGQGQGQAQNQGTGRSPEELAQNLPQEPNADQPTPGEGNQVQRNNAGGGNGGDPNRRTSGITGPGIVDAGGPLTGEDFTGWSDRLRDVEEMVSDPRLRDRAANIRERAREVRSELKRHSQQPNWDMVQENLGQPLAELRDAVAQELLRRESPEALVPLDREAVPPQYADQVRRYYERLGGGR